MVLFFYQKLHAKINFLKNASCGQRMASVLQTEILWRSNVGKVVRVAVRSFELNNLPTDRPTNWYRLLTDWLIVHNWPSQLTHCLKDRPRFCLSDCLFLCLSAWLANRLTVGMSDWLTDWPSDFRSYWLSVCLKCCISYKKVRSTSRMTVAFDFCFFYSNYLTCELWTFWMSVFLECIAFSFLSVSVRVLTSSSILHAWRSFDPSQPIVHLDWSCPIPYQKQKRYTIVID